MYLTVSLGLDSDPMQQVKSFGTDLYLKREIIGRHNGNIGVESVLGKGSTIWFDLPVTAQLKWSYQWNQLWMMKDRAIKVIVGDVDRDVPGVTGMLLEKACFEVVRQPRSSLLVAQFIGGQPDVMLIDLWMPGLPGDPLTRQIKKTPQAAPIPVIIFSAAIDGRMIAKAVGAERFIEKSLDM